jgi:hypothetical protein
VEALAAELKRVMSEPKLQSTLRERADEHLVKFQSDAVAAAYLRIMEKMIA